MYNNYGYNPYARYNQQPMYQQPLQQPVQNSAELCRPILNGKQVDSIDVAKVSDISMDGTVNYFPIADGSAIVTKQIQMDGTGKTIIYKPANDKQDDVKYVTVDDIADLEDEIKELKQELKDLKKKKKDD